MNAAHLDQVSVDKRNPDREVRVEEQLFGEEKVEDPEEVHQLGAQTRNIVRDSDRYLTFSILASVSPTEELRRNSSSSWVMITLNLSACPVSKRDKETGLWLLKPWSWPLYKLWASCWSTSRGRFLEPPERALTRIDRLCCFRDSRKKLRSSDCLVWKRGD